MGSPIAQVNNWSLNGVIITNTSGIELRNRWDAANDIGRHKEVPTFMKNVLRIFHKTIRTFNYEQSLSHLPHQHVNKHLIEKRKVIEKYKNFEYKTFQDYLVFSGKLTILKMKTNKKDISLYYPNINVKNGNFNN
eukprot:315532_1